MQSALFPTSTPWDAPDQVFDRLEGLWTLARTIVDQATMQGQAEFRRDGAGRLAYRETGRVQLLASGQSFEGHRDYLFERSPDGFSVFFAETPPRLFHRIALAPDGDALAGSAGHLCVADQYDSRYRFRADGTFEVAHTVAGPRKDYLSRTVFTRVG
jgi:hypothetical protein